MPRIVKPIVSPVGRLVVLCGATVWLLAAMSFSAPDAAGTTETSIASGNTVRVEQPAGLDAPLFNTMFLATGPDGTTFVSDTGNGRVVQLDAQDPTRLVRVFGAPGQGPGELVYPVGIAVDASGNLFVADSNLNRITKYAPDGTYLASVTHPFATTVTVTSTGDVLAWPGSGEALLQRYSNDLTAKSGVLTKSDTQRQAAWTDALFAVDRHDRLYWLDQAALTVRVFDSRFEQVDEWVLDPPGLREDMDARIEEHRKLFPGKPVRLNPILHMSITGDRVLMTYAYESRRTRVAYVYTTDGRFLQQLSDLGEEAFAAVIDPDGGLVTAYGDGVLFAEPFSAPGP